VTPIFERVVVLGLGLLGGSVALAAKSRGAGGRVVGATRRREVLEDALARGFVDEVGEPADAVRGADLVVLATPVYAMADAVRRIAPSLATGAVVTDVGSVKAPLQDTLPGLLPRGAHYVGSHPMAGSHLRGIENASADLFEGAPCVVMDAGSPAQEERVASFWSALGGRVVVRDPAGHDAAVGWMSHLPHALAFAYAAALEGAPAGADEVAGSGFRDFTRIAHSEPELWADILTANRKALAGPLAAAAGRLADLGRAVEADDTEAVERWIAGARDTLSRASRDGHELRSNDNPKPTARSSDGRKERTKTTS